MHWCVYVYDHAHCAGGTQALVYSQREIKFLWEQNVPVW